MASKHGKAESSRDGRIVVYTDGGCDPNPGRGGWGAVMLEGRRVVRELSGGEDDTTNNRMEITAALQALLALPPQSRVALHTDSMYLRDGITKWIAAWRKRGWKTTSGEPVKNQDLWRALDEAVLRCDVQWHWVRAHAGHEHNERADQLAAAAIHSGKRRAVQAKVDAATSPPTASDVRCVELYPAASHAGKSNLGAWAVVLRYGTVKKVLSGQVADTTANRMGLVAVLEGLRAINKPVPVRVFCANDYVVDGATKWLTAWRERNWRTSDKKEVGNRDLWEQLAQLLNPSIEWVSTGGVEPPELMQQAKAAATAALTATK